VAELLEERGTNVVIGDQSGIEHVLHHPGGGLRPSQLCLFRNESRRRPPFCQFLIWGMG
jgi:hypothetical protein